MAERQFIRDELFYPGLAESKHIGVKGSFAEAVGIDIHSEPGIIKAQQALAKDSGATVVDLIMASVHTSAGHSIHFGDTGKIYKRTSGGSWSLLQTVSGNPKILGAAEHSNGLIYFTYVNKVGTIQVSNDAYTAAAHTLTNTNTNFGPVIYHEKQDKIFIGNLELVAQIDSASAFTANALDLLGKYEVRDITWLDIDVLVGATFLNSVNKSRIFQWNGSGTSWQFSWFFGEAIRWMINKGETVFVLGGDEGKLYNFVDLENPVKQPPGAFSSAATLVSNLNSKVIFKGFLHFGLHDGGAGNPFPNGVYTYGTRDPRKFPRALNCDYVLSQNKVTAIEYGAISTDGANLFVAWKDSTTYGMDKINFSAKYGSAYIEFLVMAKDIEREKLWERFPVSIKPLPASCTLELKQALDHASSFTSIATISLDNAVSDDGDFKGDGVVDSNVIQLRLGFGVNSNDSPEVKALGILYTLQDLV